MFPFFAQGAAQAIEDGAVLALCLAADPDHPIAALSRYEELRRRRTARLQNVSHGRSHINHLPDGPEQQARDLHARTRRRVEAVRSHALKSARMSTSCTLRASAT